DTGFEATTGLFVEFEQFGHDDLLADRREYVTAREDQEVLAVNGDVGAAVLGVDDGVAHAHAGGDEFARGVGATSGSGGEHLTLLGLLLGGVGADQTRRPGRFRAVGTDHDTVF